LEHTDFFSVVEQSWSAPINVSDAAKIISAKFKNLRMAPKIWKRSLSNLKTKIANVKLVMGFFCLVEFKDLSIVEWNFESILEKKLQTLLHHQRLYWKQRGTIKWVTLGDALTKFFHANATIKYRRNLITMLEDDTGSSIVHHQAKADLIWTAFKQRLGVSRFSGMNLDLDNFFQHDVETAALTQPFSTEEIDAVVKSLPSDKAPGPDGFNTDFIKKCLPIVKQDF